MGVIKKKTQKGFGGGTKYVCDVCSVDITSTVRIRCAHEVCKEYDLCVPCFSEGKHSRDHVPALHSFQVIEQHSIPIFTDGWGADEEAMLLEGAETYGLGSWADIADHIGGYRDKDEVRDHYIDTYVKSSLFPLPEHSSLADRALADEWPREKFQARKKRRIEERKDAVKNAPPPAPKQKPTSSVPSCHEVQGYMPGRLEFETEYYNEAEEAVQHMQFDPGDGLVPGTTDLEPEMELKMTVMEVYNGKLDARIERKKLLFEHQLLEYKRNTVLEKRRTKEERDLFNRSKPFARLMPKQDFDDFARDLEYELNLRQAITQLQDWRQMQICDLKAGEKYEQEKTARMTRQPPPGSFDRYAMPARITKPQPPAEGPSEVSKLISPTLVLRPSHGTHDHATAATAPSDDEKKGIINGDATAHAANASAAKDRLKATIAPIPNITPLKLDNDVAPDLNLLTVEEQELCSQLRLMPKAYIAMKDGIFREAQKHGGLLKKKAAKEVCRVEPAKGGRIFDFLVHEGFIGKS